MYSGLQAPLLPQQNGLQARRVLFAWKLVMSKTLTGAACVCVSVVACPAGIPTLEKSHNKRYGKDPAYKEYKATTNLLVPGPKQKKAT